jgi:alpha-ketoglutarate-dependent 2,4-dichlorophenoxyacetate dioxygenase
MASLTDLVRAYENTCPSSSSAGSLQVRSVAAETQDGSLTIRPVLVSQDSQFGAEVSGVDWSRPISKHVVEQVGTSPAIVLKA